MFKIADHVIAVTNANAELQRYATLVIGSNTEDSVVKYGNVLDMLKAYASATIIGYIKSDV